MNRRSFLASLLAAPTALVAAAKGVSSPPSPVVRNARRLVVMGTPWSRESPIVRLSVSQVGDRIAWTVYDDVESWGRGQ